MTSPAIVVVTIFIAFTAFIIYLSRSARGRRLAQEEELRKAASLRGWTFATRMDSGYRIHTFSGTTEGIAWDAESAERVAGRNQRNQRRHMARWHGKWSPGVNAPIVCMGVPKGKEDIATTIAGGDGFFARMAVKAAGLMFDKAIDVYFGPEVGDQIDAEELRRIENVSVPGFILMAKDVNEGTRLLHEGLERALVDATNDKANILSEEDRPWVVVRSQGVSLARMQQIREIDELERFIKAGVALSRAFRFGRPIS